MPKQISVQLSDETDAQMAQLAQWWGEPEQRYNSNVIARCVDREFVREASRRGALDTITDNEQDELAERAPTKQTGDRTMKTLTDELKEYRLTDVQIKRVISTLEQGKTVRTTGSPDIESIFWNGDSNAEIVLVGGQSIERKLA